MWQRIYLRAGRSQPPCQLGKPRVCTELPAACTVPWGSENLFAAQSCLVWAAPSLARYLPPQGWGSTRSSTLCSHVSIVAMAQLAIHPSAPRIVQASFCEADCVAPPARQLLDSVVLEGGNLAGGIDVLHCPPQAQLSKLQGGKCRICQAGVTSKHKNVAATV